jgi:hypothetical protein
MKRFAFILRLRAGAGLLSNRGAGEYESSGGVIALIVLGVWKLFDLAEPHYRPY